MGDTDDDRRTGHTGKVTRRLICWLLGHRWRVAGGTPHPLPHGVRWYVCVRCRRTDELRWGHDE